MFRVARQDLWPWLDQVRAHYHRDGLLARAAREFAGRVADEPEDARADLLVRWLQAVRDSERMLTERIVDLQLFDHPDGFWLIRPLELGQGRFAELAAANPDWPAEHLYYCDATDMPDGMIDLKPFVDFIDEQITARRYLLFSTYTVDDMQSAVLQHMREPAA
jgi:hypothetical protein